MTRISDVMEVAPVSVKVSMNVYEASQIILNNKSSGAVVVGDDGKLVGMLSELDCLRAIVTSVYNGADPGGALVSEIMTPDVETNTPEDDVIAVAKSMLDHKHRRRPIVEDGELKGQLTCRQILRTVTEMVGKDA